MLAAATPAISVVKEGSVPRLYVVSLLDKAGVNGKEDEDLLRVTLM